MLAAATALVAATGTVALPTAPASAQADCLDVDVATTTYPTGRDGGIFLLSISLANLCPSPVSDWTVTLTLPPNAQVTSGWSADWSESGQLIIVRPPRWAPPIIPGQSSSFGAIGTYTGEFTGPVGCEINGSPCDGEPTPSEPPTVTLTSPADGSNVLYPCPVVLSAEASAPGGEVDRVEFYVDDTLVGSDDTAPYEIEVPSGQFYYSTHTAFARVYDSADPPRTADSEPAQFLVLVPPPALMIIACDRDIEVPAGGTGKARFHLSANDTVPTTLTVGGPGASAITVEPDSFELDGMAGHEVTITAAPGSAGATATITASAPGYTPTTINVTVTSP